MKKITKHYIVSKVEVHSWTTDFTLHEIIKGKKANIGDSPEALIHQLGKSIGKELHAIEGMKFTVKVEIPNA